MVDLLRWAWASPTLAGLHCTRVYISLFVCLDWPLTRQIFCKGWTFMASALHFSSRKWRASVVLKDIGSEDNSNWNTHGNLVLITVSYPNYAMTDHKGRLLSHRQLKLCTAVYGGHFRSGVTHEWYSYTAKIQLMIWVWSHGLLLMLHAWFCAPWQNMKSRSVLLT